MLLLTGNRLSIQFDGMSCGRNFNIDGKCLKLIKNMYSNIKSCLLLMESKQSFSPAMLVYGREKTYILSFLPYI